MYMRLKGANKRNVYLMKVTYAVLHWTLSGPRLIGYFPQRQAFRLVSVLEAIHGKGSISLTIALPDGVSNRAILRFFRESLSDGRING
jgi:hypothetical protein